MSSRGHGERYEFSTGSERSEAAGRIPSTEEEPNADSTLVETNPQEFEIDPKPLGIDEIDDQQQPVKPYPIFSRGVQLYCLAMLCGSLMKACSKLLVEELDLFVVLLARMSITSILSLSVLHYLRVEHSFWGQRDIRLLLFIRGGFGYFNIVCTYFALQYLSLPDLAVISFLTPLATSVAARVFLKEQYRWQQAVASCVSLLGVVVIARPVWLFGAHAHPQTPAQPPETESQEGSVEQRAAMHTLAVTGALMVVVTASAVMIILRKIKDRAHALTSVANYAVLSVLGSAIALMLKPSDSWSFPRAPKVWGLVILMGFFGFMLQFLSSKAIQMEEATTLSNFKYTQLLYATTLEFLLWHDVPDAISFLGMILILGGVVWSARFKHKRS